MRVILFGASKIAHQYCKQIETNMIIVAVADVRYKSIQSMNGHAVISPDDINNYLFDNIIISLDDLKVGNEKEIFSIYDLLLKMNIPDEKIVLQSFKYKMDHPLHKPRTNFVIQLSTYFEQNQISGSIAECGVYRGLLSAILSENFHDNRIYLFETFEGFNKRDIEEETEIGKRWVANGASKRLSNTSEKIVKLRCQNRKRIFIKKGYVPDTLAGIEDDFCFVVLDMDLFKPQLASFNYFKTRMVPGGVILMHDYYNIDLPGTKEVVNHYVDKNEFNIIPIGDNRSIALIKK